MDGRSRRKDCVECKLSKGNTAFRPGRIVCRLCEEGRDPLSNFYQPGILKRIMKKYKVRTPDWWYAHHGLPNPYAKRCSRCLEMKPKSAFGKYPRNRDGLQSYCKACVSKTAMESQARRA